MSVILKKYNKSKTSFFDSKEKEIKDKIFKLEEGYALFKTECTKAALDNYIHIRIANVVNDRNYGWNAKEQYFIFTFDLEKYKTLSQEFSESLLYLIMK